MRIFVGIDIPKEIKTQLDIEADKFLKYASDSRKMSTDNYHLTLKFIGEIDVAQIDELDRLLKESLKDVEAFDVHLKDLGYFKKKDGLILWMGVLQGVGALKKIHLTIDPLLSDKFNLEKSVFSPHVTLAKKVVVEHEDILRKNKTKDYMFKVSEVIIFYSHIVEDVLTYTPLSSIKLLER
ncbi:MAG: RNA 2',3'-cyclic phosphodiesterase [Acholeplasmataceae bacterium]